MPARKPLNLNQHRFPSHNRARLHYVGILHRYEPGQILTEPDRADVQALIQHDAWATSHGLVFDEISVGRTSFGRNCFRTRRSDQTIQNLSVVAALRRSASTSSDGVAYSGEKNSSAASKPSSIAA